MSTQPIDKIKAKIEELRKVEEKVTPGPWKYDCGNGQVETEDWRVLICDRVGNYERGKACEYMYEDQPSEVKALLEYDNGEDMEFIAIFRNEAKGLLDALEKAVEALDLINTHSSCPSAMSIDSGWLTRRCDEAFAGVVEILK